MDPTTRPFANIDVPRAATGRGVHLPPRPQPCTGRTGLAAAGAVDA